jgi:hypothetical protein
MRPADRQVFADVRILQMVAVLLPISACPTVQLGKPANVANDYQAFCCSMLSE